MFPLVLGSSGGSSAFLLAGVVDGAAIGIALDAGARLVGADELLGAAVADGGCLCIPGGATPVAGAGGGKKPPLAGAGAAFAMLRARISLIHRSTSDFDAVAVFGIAGDADGADADEVAAAGGVDVAGVFVAAGGIVVGGVTAGGMTIGVESSVAGGSRGGGIGGASASAGGIGGSAAGGISPPAAGGGALLAVPAILCMALSILALPSSDAAMASCIRILHCFVCPALVVEPLTIARHPGHPGVAPCSITSCL